jgi:hypothetical protein
MEDSDFLVMRSPLEYVIWEMRRTLCKFERWNLWNHSKPLCFNLSGIQLVGIQKLGELLILLKNLENPMTNGV